MSTPPETPVTQADLGVLADPRPDAPSPYRGVYPEKGGYVAKAFKRRVGGTFPTPREAAKALVAWWKAAYGRRWVSVWLLRQTPGWTLVRAAGGGWWARAELAGEAEVLLGQRGGAPCQAALTPGCRPFPTRQAARDGVAGWAEGVWGGRGRQRVRRTWAPGRSAGRSMPPRAEG